MEKKFDNPKTSVCEQGFIFFPSYLLKYSSYLDEILNRGLTISSLLVTGISA
jgi:hypothetical protein